MSHRRGWGQEGGFPARGAHHPPESAAGGQELTPFRGVDGKRRNKTQLTQKKKKTKQELGYGNDGAQSSGQTGESACSLLAGGSKDRKVFFQTQKTLIYFQRSSVKESPIPTRENSCLRARKPHCEGSRGAISLLPTLRVVRRQSEASCALDESRGVSFFGQNAPGHGQAHLKTEAPSPAFPASPAQRTGKATAATSRSHSPLQINHYTQFK